MRKITKLAVKAFYSGEDFSRDNTRVRNVGDGSLTELLLHGNRIATLDRNLCSLSVNSCGWNTTTTKERLNGVLGERNLGRIHQSDFQWYLNGQEFTGSATFDMKFT